MAWDKGVELYRKYGENSLVLKLCNGSASSFSFNKLKAGLEALIADETPIHNSKEAVQPILEEDKPKAKIWEKKQGVKNFDALPEVLQKKRIEVGQLFKEMILLRKEMHQIIGTKDRRPIDLEEAFAMMDQVDSNGDAIPFSIVYVTYNQELNTGGDVIRARAKVRFKQKGVQRFASGKKKVATARKNPNHSKHGTVNIQWVNTLEYRTVHTYLIFEINGLPVTLGKNG